MKLLCVIPSYWPAFQYGGPIASNHNLNKALVKKGIDVTVYTTNVGLGERVPINKEVDVDGVKVTYFGFMKFFEFMGTTGWQFSLPMTRALRKNIKNFDLVCVISVWNYPVTVASHYSRKYKKPYIISPRGLLYPYTTGKKSWKKLPYYYLVAKRDLKGAAAIHYTTDDEAEKCHLFLGLKNQAIVIPNGIDLSKFNDLPPKETFKERYPYLKDKKVILFLSRINWKKGLDILAKAFGMLAKERDDVHLLIVGNDEGGYSEKVKGWVKEYGMNYVDCGLKGNPAEVVKGTLHRGGRLGIKEGIKDVHVTFTGMLTGQDKLKAYVGSDLFVLPSYSENFGMAAVEAMACGVPVVISNKVGIYKEIQENKAGIVVDTNAESLYKGIKSVLDNENLARELSTNGKKLVENYYDIDKVADRMMEVYEGTLKRWNV
ncbi:MAG: glycosyltransferase [Thermodesulfovibrionales bacterium]|nr:glycosyltransferase [Thermodesulfovibrionales bacterium]